LPPALRIDTVLRLSAFWKDSFVFLIGWLARSSYFLFIYFLLENDHVVELEAVMRVVRLFSLFAMVEGVESEVRKVNEEVKSCYLYLLPIPTEPFFISTSQLSRSCYLPALLGYAEL
jgi:hypothetical protein